MEHTTDRCTGDLVAHADGWVECTEPGCEDLAPERHTWIVDCLSEWDDCVCRHAASRRRAVPQRPAA